ncbi:acetyl-CoA synthetase [Dipodascopsis tothii]|uniref:acetyl-CoA synthetase n=1 Tax=Dipodascopsis tothii TaxID=44089 RepID=UPI0034CFCDB1
MAPLDRLHAILAQVTGRRPHKHELNPNWFLPRAVEIEPDAVAIVHRAADGTAVEYTYAQFGLRVRRLATYLRSRYAPGTVVGILAPNTPMFLEALFAISMAGLVKASYNYRLSAGEVAQVVAVSRARAVLVDAEYVRLLADARGLAEIVVDADIGGPGGANGSARGDSWPVPPGAVATSYTAALAAGAVDTLGWDALAVRGVPEDSVLSLAFTSGTTSTPKAVEYTHRGMYLGALANIVESGLNNGRCRYLWTLPMFHAGGWTFPYAVTAVRGTHVCLRRMDYGLIWHYLKTGVSHYNGAPTVNAEICAHADAERLPQPVRVTVAAAAPSPALFERMHALNLDPIHVYGLTETYGPCTRTYALPAWDALPPNERFARLARQGHGFLTAEPTRVVRRGTMTDVARDGREVGEILLRGNICMRGYAHDRAATAAAYAGGWFHTGDLAVMHPDGAIQITDREKDVIVSGGENISSVAVESVLLTHPAVFEAALVAVPDDKFGERPKAFLTLRPGARLDVDDFRAWMRARLGGFQIPREIELVPELPKTSTGKIRKNELRARRRP